jgi:hypothetical protein
MLNSLRVNASGSSRSRARALSLASVTTEAALIVDVAEVTAVRIF